MDRLGLFSGGGGQGGAPLSRTNSSSSHVTPRTLGHFEHFFRQSSGSGTQGEMRVKFSRRDRDELPCSAILDINSSTTIPVLQLKMPDNNKSVSISIKDVETFKTEGPECIVLRYRSNGDDQCVAILRPEAHRKNEWVFAFQRAVALYLSTVVRDKKNVVASETKIRDVNSRAIHIDSSIGDSIDAGEGDPMQPRRNYSVDDNSGSSVFINRKPSQVGNNQQIDSPSQRSLSTNVNLNGSGGFSMGGFNSASKQSPKHYGVYGASPSIPIGGGHMSSALGSSFSTMNTSGISGSLGGLLNSSNLSNRSGGGVAGGGGLNDSSHSTHSTRGETKLARSYVSPEAGGSVLLQVMGNGIGDHNDSFDAIESGNDEIEDDGEDETWKDTNNGDEFDDRGFDNEANNLTSDIRTSSNPGSSHDSELLFDLDDGIDDDAGERDSYASNNSGRDNKATSASSKSPNSANNTGPSSPLNFPESVPSRHNSNPGTAESLGKKYSNPKHGDSLVGSFNGKPLHLMSSSYSKSSNSGLSSIFSQSRVQNNSPDILKASVLPPGCSKVNWESGSSCRRGPRSKQEDFTCTIVDLCDRDAPSYKSNNNLPNYSSSSRSSEGTSEHGCGYFAVYDGHGGDQAARYLSDELHGSISSHELFELDIEKSLERSCIDADKSFCKMCDAKGWTSGTTALGVLIRGTDLYVFNIGDCQAVICNSEGKYEDINDPHKPTNKSESERIIRAKGWITEEKELHVGKLAHMDLSEVGNREPQWTSINRICGDLSVARSIGDCEYKNFEPGKEFKNSWMFIWPDGHDKIFLSDLVIPDPEVRKIGLLTCQYDFVIIASDGLWDVVEKKDAVQFVRSAFAQGKTPVIAAEELSELAILKGTSDNVTVIIIRILYS